jgi:hypothetical protein
MWNGFAMHKRMKNAFTMDGRIRAAMVAFKYLSKTYCILVYTVNCPITQLQKIFIYLRGDNFLVHAVSLTPHSRKLPRNIEHISIIRSRIQKCFSPWISGPCMREFFDEKSSKYFFNYNSLKPVTLYFAEECVCHHFFLYCVLFPAWKTF